MKNIKYLLIISVISCCLSVAHAQDNAPETKKPNTILELNILKPGLIEQEQELTDLDAIEWTLSNGLHVILKPTTFKKNEILMHGFSWGGKSVVKDLTPETVKSLNDLMSISGVGHLTKMQTDELLIQESVTFVPYLDQITDNIKGSCRIENFETLLKLVNLYFSELSTDKDSYAKYSKELQANLEQIPQYKQVFADSVSSVLYNHYKLRTPLKASDVKKIHYDQAMTVVKDRYNDINNFTFVFVGDFQLEDVKTPVETFLGSIVNPHRKEYWQHDDNMIVVMKRIISDYKYKNQPDAVQGTIVYAGKMPYSFGNELTIQTIGNILQTTFKDKLKINEENKFTFDITLKKYPHEIYLFQADFITSPKQKSIFTTTLTNTLEAIAEKGVSEKEVEKSKSALAEQHHKDLKDNQYWIDVINDKIKLNINKAALFEDMLHQVSASTVQNLAQQMVQQAKLEVIQNPK